MESFQCLYSFPRQYQALSKFYFGFEPWLFIQFFPGFLGDQIGYKAVIIFNILMTGLIGTSFDWTPRYSETIRAPSVTLFKFNSYAVTNYVVSTQWALCDVPSPTTDLCASSEAFINGFANLSSFLDCQDDSAFSLAPFHLEMPRLMEMENGTFCLSNNTNFSIDDKSEGIVQDCFIKDYPSLPTCLETTGSHGKTFGVYFGLRLIYQWVMNSAFSMLDAAALKQASQFNSDYSYIMFWYQLAWVFGPLVSGFVIDDEAEGQQIQGQSKKSA